MNKVVLSALMIMSTLLICGCAKEEPGIVGGSGHWLSNDTVALRGVAVYRKSSFPQSKQSFMHMLVGIRNESAKEIEISWVRAEFRGKGIQPNMVWSPVFTDTIPEHLTVKGIVKTDRISEVDMSEEESGLDFPFRILHPQDTCVALLSPVNPDEPAQVKIKIRFGDGTLSSPFIISVVNPGDAH